LGRAGVSEVAAVVRAALPEAAERARKGGAVVVTNPRPEEEMLVSIRLGLDAISTDPDAVFVWPADHPAVSAATVRLLAERADPARALLPTYLSRRGHPALIGRGLLPEIARIPPEEGLRPLWRIRLGPVRAVAGEGAGVIRNADTPAEYDELAGIDS